MMGLCEFCRCTDYGAHEAPNCNHVACESATMNRAGITPRKDRPENRGKISFKHIGDLHSRTRDSDFGRHTHNYGYDDYDRD